MPFPVRLQPGVVSRYRRIDQIQSLRRSAGLSDTSLPLSPQISHLYSFDLHFQVNMQRIYLASFSARPTFSTCEPTLCRTASTGWPSRSRSWTPPWRKVREQDTGSDYSSSNFKHCSQYDY